MSTIFFFGKTKLFERFFYRNTIPVWFYRIFTYIWSISLCKFTQLQESEMRPTGWTLSYFQLTQNQISLTHLILSPPQDNISTQYIKTIYKSTRVQEYKSTRVQEYKSTGVQEYKATRVQEYKSTRIQEYKSTRVQEYKSTRVKEYRKYRKYRKYRRYRRCRRYRKYRKYRNTGNTEKNKNTKVQKYKSHKRQERHKRPQKNHATSRAKKKLCNLLGQKQIMWPPMPKKSRNL